MKSINLLSLTTLFFVTLVFSSCNESGDKSENNSSENEEEKIEIPNPDELLTQEDLKAVLNIVPDSELEMNQEYSDLDKTLTYRFDLIYPAQDSLQFDDTAKVNLMISYVNPGKATYKTHKEAIAFLEKKLETEPENYKKVDDFPLFAVSINNSLVGDFEFVYENVLISILMPLYKFSHEEKVQLAIELGKKIVDRLPKK